MGGLPGLADTVGSVPRLKSIKFAALVASLTLGLAACGSGTTSAGAAPSTPTAASTSATDSSTPPDGSPSPTPAVTPSHTTKPTPKPTATHTTKPPAAPTGKNAAAGTYVFPVTGHVSYARTHHDYPATDIIAACGLRYMAPINGVVLEVTRVDTWKASTNLGPTRGGLSVSIKGDDGVRYYGSHFSKVDSFVKPGLRVKAGEQLATVGKTGDASGCHVHFGISPVCAGTGDWYNRRGLIYPWPYLDSWRKGGELSPVAAVNAWQKSHGCPTKPLTDP
jgi:murein DD-endopeptidase MepM/ murein hydrolase activator NlpD